LGLAPDGKIVLGIEHRFTLSNPALVSALFNELFSSARVPILA
jgi:hypothetical protein